MLTSLIRYLKGYLRIRVAGYSPERFLNACSHRGIYIWNLTADQGAYDMYITIKGFHKLKPIIKKTGTKVIITERFGLPFFLHRYRKRKLFFSGAAGCVFLVYLLSLFIWNIDISGNIRYSDDTILTFLESRDITHGMKKSEIDCAGIVKALRKEYNDIVWASASVKGTRLFVQIKENEDSYKNEESDSAIQEQGEDIVADRDCVITEMITRSGTPMVHVGDSVKKGDILVSGRVEILNDSGEVTGYHYLKSDADIRGQTSIVYEERQNLTYTAKKYENIKKEFYFIRAGHYIIGFGAYKNPYETFEIWTEETALQIGKNFLLPFSYGTRTIIPYQPVEKSYGKEEIQDILSEKFSRYCADKKKKGVEILQNNVKIYTERDFASAKGTLTILTDIGGKLPTEEIPLPETTGEDGTERTDTDDGNE